MTNHDDQNLDVETNVASAALSDEDQHGANNSALDDDPSNDESVNANSDNEPETFPRKVVEDLRRENARYRQRAQQADDLAARLHTALVAATGRLADPSDLPFSEDHLGDEDALTAAVDDLLARKPHLASRRPRGDVGQGMTGSGTSTDLAGMLRSRA